MLPALQFWVAELMLFDERLRAIKSFYLLTTNYQNRIWNLPTTALKD